MLLNKHKKNRRINTSQFDDNYDHRNIVAKKVPLLTLPGRLDDQSKPKFEQTLNLDSPKGNLLNYSERQNLMPKSLGESNLVSPRSDIQLEDINNSLNGHEEQEDNSKNQSPLNSFSNPRIEFTPMGARSGYGPDSMKFKATLSFKVTNIDAKPTFRERIRQCFQTKKKREELCLKEQLRRKQVLFVKTVRNAKTDSNKLLKIIAEQAFKEGNSEVSRIFRAALTRVNVEALDKARKEIQQRKKASRSILKSIRSITLSFFQTWKPDSRFIIYSKVVLLICILIQVFLASFTVAFLEGVHTPASDQIRLMDLIMDFVYIYSMLLRFRTAYYHKGELRESPRDIIKYYLKGCFAFDLITCIGIIGRLAPNNITRFLLLFSLLRLYYVVSLIACIEDHFQFNRQVRSLFEVIKMCMAIFVLAHLFGCVMYSITFWEPIDMTWLSFLVLAQAGIFEIYVACLYWAICTMSTVGYGDITPQTTKERILTIVIMVCSSIVFGYLLSSIGNLLTELTAYSSESREKLRLLNIYMAEKGLKKDIQSRIRRYLEFYLSKENKLKTEGDGIIQLLSQNLKDEIIKEVNAKVLNDCYMFSSNFRKKFLYLVSRDLKEKSFGPEEVIFQHNDCDDFSMYFVTTGRVQLYYEKTGNELCPILKGQSFGFISFFSGRPRTASTKSVEFTTAFVLSREDFLSRLEDYSTEKEMFIMIKDALKLYNNYQYLNIRCYSCGQKDHIAIECPKIHFSFSRNKIITNFISKENAERKKYRRKSKRKFRPLQELDAMQEAVNQHQMVQHNELYFESFEEDDEEADRVCSYSSIDDVLDRNIYDIHPLVYTGDVTQLRTVNISGTEDILSNSLHLNSTQHDSYEGKRKKKKQKTYVQQMGEIEAFVNLNYDKYYHNLNLDRVKNFEVFHPENNIIKMLVKFEEARLKKLVESRLGVKAAQVSNILIKGFRLHERALHNGSQASFNSPVTRNAVEKRPMHRPRRSSFGANPADIAMYNTSDRRMFSKQFGSVDSARSSDLSTNHLRGSLMVPNSKRIKDQPRNSMFVSSNLGMSKDHHLFPRDRNMRTIKEEKRSLDDILLFKGKTESKFPSISLNKKEKASSCSDSSSDENTSSQAVTSSISSSMTQKSKEIMQLRSPRADEAREGIQNPSLPEQIRLNLANMNTRNQKRVSTNLLSIQNQSIDSKRISTATFNNDANQGTSVFIPSTSMNYLDHEDPGQKRPVALFDFTQLVKKITQKLDENQNSATCQSATVRKQIYQTFESYDSSKINKNNETLFIKMLRQSHKASGKVRKQRSTSEDHGKGVKAFIDKHGLEDLMDSNKK